MKQATTDLAVIERWWRLVPMANVAIATGSASGLLVVDVDGEQGQASLRRLLDEHGGDEPFRAVWVRTGSGGWHAYLRMPSGVKIPNSAGRLGQGLDVRGDGGYVVAPPSMHVTGRRYEWHRDGSGGPPPTPPWLAESLVPPAPPERSTRPVLVSVRSMSPYVMAAVENEARAVADAPVGQRNERLNRASFSLGQLVGAGLVSEATVAEVLALAGQGAGLGEREITLTIASGLRAGIAHPREVA